MENEYLTEAPPMPVVTKRRDHRQFVLGAIALVALIAIVAGAVMAYQGKAGALSTTQHQLAASQAETRDALAAQSSTQASLDAATSQIAACKVAVPDMKKIIVLEANGIQSLLKAVRSDIFLAALYVRDATGKIQQAGHMADSTRTEADACESSSGSA